MERVRYLGSCGRGHHRFHDRTVGAPAHPIEPNSDLMTVLPMVLIPVYLVPLSIVLHIASLAKLRRSGEVMVHA